MAFVSWKQKKKRLTDGQTKRNTDGQTILVDSENDSETIGVIKVCLKSLLRLQRLDVVPQMVYGINR